MSLIAKYEEFQNICRTCLFIGKLRPIIDSVIIKIIHGISGIDVKNDTDLPQNICESCFKKIYKINEFAVQCKRNELTLNKCKTEYFERKTIENTETEIKDEITIDDEMIRIKQEIKTEPIESSQSKEKINRFAFNCNICAKKFVDSRALIEHKRTHEKQFPFKCDVCNKPIRHEATLKRHKLIHKREKPQCNVCFKIFFDWNALKIHRRTHMFACEMCDKSFNSSYFLRLHYRTEHSSVVEADGEVDDLTLESRSELKKLETDVLFEEVVIKLDTSEAVVSEESNKNECDPFEITTTINDEIKDEVQSEKIVEDVVAEPLFPAADSDNCFRMRMRRDRDRDNNDGKRARERNFCMFCKTTVLNFVRHITRNHAKEAEVKRVLATAVGSKERKDLLSLLRKRGNYLINLTRCTKPVKKTRISRKFLPCTYCLGFYSSSQLWKHRKICIAQTQTQTQTQTQSSRACTAEAQNLLVQRLHQVDETLREWVFPRMRADDISLLAKNDALICAWGARYLKAHRGDAHLVNVTSRRMRELAKLLAALRHLDAGVEQLVHALQVRRFGALVAAVKRVAQYDAATGVFASPTYAAQIGATLRQCCDIALLQSDAVANEAIRTFVAHLESHWRTAVPLPAAVVAPHTQKQSHLLTETAKTIKHNNNNRTKRVLVPWTSEQKRVVDGHFREHICRRKAPKKPECEALIQAHPLLLHNKSWLKIKVYVQNKYSK